MKICKDGRIWGQNNKLSGSHLGILTGRKKYIPELYNGIDGRKNPNRANHLKKFVKGNIPWNKGIKRMDITGCKHPNWKGGVSKTKEWRKERNRIWRTKNPEKSKYCSKLDKHRRRAIGYINIKIIQSIYEENIKKFGTLTCIYCLLPIEFRKDTLEHKIPISKGGTNAYENLSIACLGCNTKKNNKTYEQFKKEKEREVIT